MLSVCRTFVFLNSSSSQNLASISHFQPGKNAQVCWCGCGLQIRPRPRGAGTWPGRALGFGRSGYSEPLARGRSASSPKGDRPAAPRRGRRAQGRKFAVPGGVGPPEEGKEPGDPDLRSEFVPPSWRPGGGCPPRTAAAGLRATPRHGTRGPVLGGSWRLVWRPVWRPGRNFFRALSPGPSLSAETLRIRWERTDCSPPGFVWIPAAAAAAAAAAESPFVLCGPPSQPVALPLSGSGFRGSRRRRPRRSSSSRPRVLGGSRPRRAPGSPAEGP